MFDINDVLAATDSAEARAQRDRAAKLADSERALRALVEDANAAATAAERAEAAFRKVRDRVARSSGSFNLNSAGPIAFSYYGGLSDLAGEFGLTGNPTVRQAYNAWDRATSKARWYQREIEHAQQAHRQLRHAPLTQDSPEAIADRLLSGRTQRAEQPAGYSYTRPTEADNTEAIADRILNNR
jgi:hypothetical protein